MGSDLLEIGVVLIVLGLIFLAGRRSKPDMNGEQIAEVIRASAEFHEGISDQLGAKHDALMAGFSQMLDKLHRDRLEQRAWMADAMDRIKDVQIDTGNTRRSLIDLHAKTNTLTNFSTRLEEITRGIYKIHNWVGNISEPYPIAAIGKMANRATTDLAAIRRTLTTIASRSFADFRDQEDLDWRTNFDQGGIFGAAVRSSAAIDLGRAVTIDKDRRVAPFEVVDAETTPKQKRVGLSSNPSGSGFVKEVFLRGNEPTHIHPLAKDEPPCEPASPTDAVPETSADKSDPSTRAIPSSDSPTIDTPTIPTEG